MPRFDARVEVLCDDCGCTDWWEPEYVYHDWSGKSGQYDTSDEAFSKWCRRERWTTDGDKTLCDECSQ